MFNLIYLFFISILLYFDDKNFFICENVDQWDILPEQNDTHKSGATSD